MEWGGGEQESSGQAVAVGRRGGREAEGGAERKKRGERGKGGEGEGEGTEGKG
jgi:hypothetical protein